MVPFAFQVQPWLSYWGYFIGFGVSCQPSLCSGEELQDGLEQTWSCHCSAQCLG